MSVKDQAVRGLPLMVVIGGCCFSSKKSQKHFLPIYLGSHELDGIVGNKN